MKKIILLSFVFIGLTYPTASAAPKRYEEDSLWNIAHRGASGYAPESTLHSFRLARELKADFIELDLQVTKDGHLVVFHDDTLERTTGQPGRIADYTLDKLKKFRAGEWFNKRHPKKSHYSYKQSTIPTLEEVFRTLGKSIRYCIELKENVYHPQLNQKLLFLLEKYQLNPKSNNNSAVVIQSFNTKQLKKLHRLNPRLPLFQLLHLEEARSLSNYSLKQIKRYAAGIGLFRKWINREDIHRSHQAGLRVHTYTVNRKKDIQLFIKKGVDGICTNYPDRLHRAIEQARKK